MFNRPDHVAHTFDAIRQAKPKQLFVAADGPRNESDQEGCQKCREIVVSNVTWDCHMTTRFLDYNLGCKKAVSSAIDWFFEHVEYGIILEDDCLPSPDFFHFCSSLLHYYKDDDRIMHISGSNFNTVSKQVSSSYIFSKYGLIWGWATWKRAWRYYDVDIREYQQLKEHSQLEYYWPDLNERLVRIKLYDNLYAGNIDTWDYQWSLTKYMQNGLSIIPKVNLVSNIGFDNLATHTKHDPDNYKDIKAENLEGDIIHPKYILRDAVFDEYFLRRSQPAKKSAFKNVLKKILKILK